MPVGTGFSNSAMKTSFSMSSLQTAETPEKGIKMRPYNSLTKKKRKEMECFRHSWGSNASASDQKDDFWSAALQANYNYIMDNQLIDNCQEANGEINSDGRTWSKREFYTQFSELYSWLNSVQEILNGNEQTDKENSLVSLYLDQVVKKSSLLKLFNEQASQIVQLHPDMEEEVSRRVLHLNSMWDAMEAAVGLCKHCDHFIDIKHEIKHLRIWMKNMETRLQPLVFRIKWSKTDIEKKLREHRVLHRDIQNHGKIVTSVVKLSKQLADVGVDDSTNARHLAKNLEKRWHLLYLRSLEWQCYIDGLTERTRNTSSGSSSSEYDDEPANKYPKLNHNYSVYKNSSSEDSCFCEANVSSTQSVDKVDGPEHCEMVKAEQNQFADKSKNKNTPQNKVLSESAKATEDMSNFTKSNRNAPNQATYYFKHEDTDTDIKRSNIEVQLTMDESSDDEWVYSSNNTPSPHKHQDGASQSSPNISALRPSQDIRRLVQEAEILVRETPVKKGKRTSSIPANKMSRVKQWLNMDKPSDSCDASAEDDEKESHTSEDFNESIATCRPSQDVSFSELDRTPKITMRQKRTNIKGNRPWSVSCISQLSHSSNSNASTIPNFSISESALHQLSLSPKYCKTLTTSTNSIGLYANNSTSSTVEEGGAPVIEDKSLPVRKKRLKLKRKASIKKKENSETFCYNTQHLKMGTLVKSISFSGCSCKIAKIEQHSASDPSSMHLGQRKQYDTSTSGADTDDDRHNKRMPVFKIGAKTSYLLDGNISTEKIGINTVEEQSSSLSEQAWDSYQEKYLSEAYSETHDSDAARKLLEFGEDYRNFLDSQSDWSTQSTNFEVSPLARRRTLTPFNILESESDTEDVRHILKESRDQLLYTTNIYKLQLSLGLREYLKSNDVADMIATCDRHIFCLQLVEKPPAEYSIVKLDKEETAELIMQWQKLRGKVNKLHDYRNLQKEILLLKDEVAHFRLPFAINSLKITSLDDINKEIEYYSNELMNTQEYKKKLLTVNVAVHRFITENKDYSASTLKSDISELYRLWYDYHCSANERLNQLNSLLQTWQMLEHRLDQLRGDLQDDEQTLGVLDAALRDGTLSDDMAVSVRDVAKVLSETQQNSNLPSLLSEGSLSDSGISDEGSEHELGERARRLASIRRLVRQLEAVLSPDCITRIRMSERLLEAEEELRVLQKRCRSLIVRTAVNAAAPRSFSETVPAVCSGAGDPGDEPTGPSWLMRVMRSSVPFQLAIIALLCVACLLEPPHCCDNMNNYSLSFSPQLRYIHGPPPV